MICRMESEGSIAVSLDACRGDSILIETVKDMVNETSHTELENEEESFFVVSNVQSEQQNVMDVSNDETAAIQSNEQFSWSTLCRVCANTSDHLIPIFEGEGSQHDLCNKIHKYLPIHISEDDTLPLQLCYHCAATLLAWHELLEGCLSAERRLLEMYDESLDKQSSKELETSLQDTSISIAESFQQQQETVKAEVPEEITVIDSGKGPLIVSGSDIAQSIVLESAGIVKGWLSYNNNQLLYLSKSIYNTSFSRLAVDIPHAIVTFMNDTVMYNEHQHERVSRKILLAQILGQTIWRLSESLIIKWNPSYFNETAYTTLDWVNNGEDKENVQRSLDKLLNNVKTFNRKIDTVDSINSLDTRILNDVLLDLDRVLLCPDKEHRSKTDWSLFLKPSHDLLGSTYLSEVVKCYENAIQLLQENIDL
ncbi:uncharacterized protein LOC108626738 isoform X7 [Ceratina calcarata]|uniref:Uncharacterized protein LOC108626738 isoform X7 n=1 Tax=Ceratina calcarata TaxID=156304 RepID=A0AAJ7S3U6_9HYME|nr:uncharacterized protein LOC108626738 isoform X7 [Ceratina calcarata]